MVIQSIMKEKVVTVEMDDSLEVIREIFQREQFHHLLVVSKHKLLGVISDRDLLKAVSPFVDTFSETMRDRATLQKRAHQIMTRHPITVSRDTDIQAAVTLFVEKGISCLPVTALDGTLEGIVSWRDMLHGLFHHD